MGLPAQNYVAWQAITLILHATGVLFSLYRLKERFRTRRLWWDDYAVCVPLILNIIYVITSWWRLAILKEQTNLSPEQKAHPIHSYWLSSFLYYTVLGFSRISLALSLTRIYPTEDSRRRAAVILVWVFMVLYLLTVIMPFAACPGLNVWYYMAMDRCIKERRLGYASGIVIFALDVLSDVVLVLLPVYWLRRTDMKPRLRSVMIMAFCASFLSLLAALNCAILVYTGIDLGVDRRLIAAMVAHIQTGIALIVCNFLVVTMKFYRRVHSSDSSEDSYTEDFTSRRSGMNNISRQVSAFSPTGHFAMRSLTNRDGRRSSPHLMRPPVEVKPSPVSSSSLPVVTTIINSTTSVTTSLPSPLALINRNTLALHDAVAVNQMDNSAVPTHGPSSSPAHTGLSRPPSVHISTIKNHSKSAPG